VRLPPWYAIHFVATRQLAETFPDLQASQIAVADAAFVGGGAPFAEIPFFNPLWRPRAMIRPSIFSRSLKCMLFALATAMFTARAAHAQDAEAAAAKVPIDRVVLFNSGVGYFEHRGTVAGDATIDFNFRVGDINDLLKSMVVQDLGGGQISTVTYPSRDPVTKTLQSFAIDLTNNPSLGELLAQIRGESIEIDAPTRIEGSIVSVEKQKKSIGEDQTIEVEYLTVLTDSGLRRIALDSVGRIKLARPELDAELRRSLEVLAMGHATDKKTVSLRFTGEGEREVRVGYITEAPIWKTSYRLVLDAEEEPFLQGWSIVQNTTETDWQDVQMNLVSGRPISFVMDLYSPLYVPRPEVVPELYASLRPQVYEQALERGREKAEGEQRFGQSAERAPAQEPADSTAAGLEARRGGRMAAGFGFGAAGEALGRNLDRQSIADAHLLSESVQAAAQGADVGELFQYDIQNPVTLARQQSAMLPIVNQAIEGRKVSIYNASVHAKHPLDGFELKNSSDLHLMQGPVTVFDGGVYAGDARIPELPPASERLLSYALDLEIEVAPSPKDAPPQQLLTARIEKGVLTATFKQSRTQSYTVKNSGDRAKTVLIEQPVEANWELLSPKPTETTRDVHRFAVAAKPGEPATLKIDEEQIVRQTVAIAELNDASIQMYLIHLGKQEVAAEVKDALREVVRQRKELADLARRKQQLEQEIATISQEQERIRGNIQAIDRNTDLYNRYVKKFADQEDQVERNREEIRSLEQQINTARQSLDEYLSNLNLP
jgi:hypothetical protein